MTRIYIICEGATEEEFVNHLLAPFFLEHQIYVTALSVDGVVPYHKIRKAILNSCHDKKAFVTTMIDFYGLHDTFPSINNISASDCIYKKMSFLEQEFSKDINRTNFIPNIILHEFEGLLFSNPEQFKEFGDTVYQHILSDRNQYQTPEHINDHKITAPSKRILNYYPYYRKIADGNTIAKSIGLDSIRQQCLHFNKWIEKLLSLKGVPDAKV